MAGSFSSTPGDPRARAKEHAEGKNSPEHSESHPHETGRRNVLTAIAAGLIGFVLALFPFAAGAMVFLDPILRKRDDGREPGKGDDKPGKWLRITSVAAVPSDGEPVQFPVIDDLVDAWHRIPDQPVGAVYLRRIPAEKAPAGFEIEAFNAICPHAGCFVAFSDASQTYKCPCHNSSFKLDGSRIDTPGVVNPAPRPLDKLEVDQQRVADENAVWVRFVNFYTGKEEQVPK